ncbi:hypothetical protein HRR08_02395 [Gardnerella vaginalis]|uniref:hypothetical protein n=1 Tax=Gardnerella swidsinskii TaxID=2792979 RepID=UPI0015735B72|nr:hypothetical protein [Gardnerella vaginalis]
MNINADELVSFPKQIKIVLKLRALLTHTIQLLFNHTVHESCLINISPLHKVGAKGVFSKGLKENQLKAFKREHKK